MTLEEYNETFDDDHQMHFFCVAILDGEGEDDRRNAQLRSTINNSAMNATLLSGHKVADDLYHDTEHYMPRHLKAKRRITAQPWDDMRQGLGFHGNPNIDQ